jgi:protein-S-isoprenylcysteine O-methyltransferase Ste14
MMTVTVSKLIWVFGIIAWYVIRFPHQRRARRIAVDRDAGGGVDQLLLIVALWGQFLIPLSYVAVSVSTGQPVPGDYPFHPWQGWAGLIVLGAALALFRLTHKQLGRNWSVALETRSDHKLVTEGVYAYVRHPMYSSFLLSAIAQALLLPNWIAGPVGLVAFGLLFFSRINREEAMMLETFGDSYRDYQGKTARIVPWLY